MQDTRNGGHQPAVDVDGEDLAILAAVGRATSAHARTNPSLAVATGLDVQTVRDRTNRMEREDLLYRFEGWRLTARGRVTTDHYTAGDRAAAS